MVEYDVAQLESVVNLVYFLQFKIVDVAEKGLAV